MTNRQNLSSPTPIRSDSLLHVVILVCFVFVVSYLAARLGGALVLRPEMIWPVWPGCAFLVAVLLLNPRKTWPAILLAGLAGFALYDLQENLPIRTIGLLLLADSVEILVAALGVRYLFAGVPHLNSVKALAKYSLFAVILAPISVASTAGNAIEGDSWWVGFFTEALALLSLTPAILSWAEIARTRARKRKVQYLEAAALLVGLGTAAYFTFVTSGVESGPALLYSLVPFLLWAALRFGITGISNSIVLVAFLAILGAVHGHGPFTGHTPVNDVLSLQLFLLVSASSFMVLAAVVEGNKTAEQTVREREAALRVSEERLRLAAQAGKMYAYEWDVASDIVVRSGESVSVVGFSDQGKPVTRRQLLAGVHPDDRALFNGSVDQISRENTTSQISYRVLRPDGSVVWLEKSARAIFDEHGKLQRMIGMVADITKHKLAEEALSQVSRKLIEAQEQERTRIARELHDDIGQRLALLAIEMQQFHLNSPELPYQVRSHADELWKKTTEIATDIQTLSHELHSSKLQHLGVAVAMRSFCKEFGDQQKVEIDIQTNDLPGPLSPDTSLCLFRVLQEALHNSAKHSGVRHFQVRLWGTTSEIHLTVSDSGCGFDREVTKASPGLGLVSMEERVKALNGTLLIDSQPKRGTTIHANVPVSSESGSMSATG